MRIVVALLALVAVFAASAAGATDPRSEKVRLRPADVALAKSAVLRQSDVGPDWLQVKTPKDDDSQFECPGFDPDFSRFTITGRAYASFREPSGAQIDSTVAVFKTRAQAVGDFRLGAKPQYARCLAGKLRKAFRSYPAGVQGTVLSSSMVTAPILRERAVAYAVKARLTGPRGSLPLWVDLVAVQRGRSIAALFFTAVGSRLPSRQYFAAAVANRLR